MIYVGVTTSQGVIGRWLVVVPEPGVGLAVLGALALMVGRRDRR
ncbi:MAG: PEP-CTERM sorting domain-containing protein [Planctomycetota bacterium]